MERLRRDAGRWRGVGEVGGAAARGQEVVVAGTVLRRAVAAPLLWGQQVGHAETQLEDALELHVLDVAAVVGDTLEQAAIGVGARR